MEDQKIYLLAELTIQPGCLEEVKVILKEALRPTLLEPGCEALDSPMSESASSVRTIFITADWIPAEAVSG